jgi:hypothetical protein
MALTKKMLQAMGIEDTKIEQIFEAHEESINVLRTQRDKLQADLDKEKEEAKRLATVEKDLVKANARIEDLEDTEKKLKDLRKEYDGYKADVEAKAVIAGKAKLYKELLTKAGIPEKRHEAIIRITDLETVKIGADGKIANEKELSEAIDSEWADFKVTEGKQGANTPKPPENTGGTTFDKMSLAEKMSYANEHPDSDEVQAWLK